MIAPSPLASSRTASTYDFENHMLTHGALSMTYDGDGNRVSETVGSTTTKYLIDTLNPTGYSQVLDELVSGAVTKTYTYGGLARAPSPRISRKVPRKRLPHSPRFSASGHHGPIQPGQLSCTMQSGGKL